MSARAWLRAARPLAHANIAPALVFGQALAYADGAGWHVGTALAIHAFGLVDHLFIVFANDVADEATDARNTTHNVYSGGSRVLAEGALTASALARAAVVAGVLVIAAGAALAALAGEPALLALAVAAIALLLAYSFPPLKLSYRGGGEALQGLGVGVVLPLVGYLAQTGVAEGGGTTVHRSAARLVMALGASFVFASAGNVLTALPDTPSDRQSAKRTWPVRRGERAARRDALVLLTLGIAVVAARVAADAGIAAAAGVALPPAGLVLLGARSLDRGDASDRTACFRFVTLGAAAAGCAQLAWAVLMFARGR